MKKFSLPKDGGLIEAGLPNGIKHTYERIPAHIFEDEELASQRLAEKIVKANDIKAHLRHAALVDFNDLPLIDEKIGKGSNLMSNDRDIIIVMLKAVLGNKD